MSIPAPVSASPPSCRSPSSTLGVRDSRPASVKPREPSRPVRKRVTAASVAARLPSGLSTPSIAVPTQNTSALNASSKLPEPPATSSPRVPAAAIAIDRSLSSAGPASGVSSRPPFP